MSQLNKKRKKFHRKNALTDTNLFTSKNVNKKQELCDNVIDIHNIRTASNFTQLGTLLKII